MNNLIKIETTKIGDNEINSVNARELHEFLESKQDFSTWIKNRVDKYGFAENVDYLLHKFMEQVSHQGGYRNRVKIDYIISLDMAKELAMVENNDKGRQARRYFIEVEKRYKQQIPQVENLSRLQILEMALESEKKYLAENEKTKQLTKTITEQAPKVEFYDEVGKTTNTHTLGVFAKVLGTGEKRLFAFLRNMGVLIDSGSKKNTPYQKYLTAGYFQIDEKLIPWAGGQDRKTYLQTKITGKGQQFVHRLWSNYTGQGLLNIDGGGKYEN
jgi:anti-repressor protein